MCAPLKTINRILSVLLCTSVLLACGGDDTNDNGSEFSGCSAPADLPLVDIEDVVNWINAMEKPLTLPCFLSSLPRPMAVNLTDSDFSVQPALGEHSPRVFIFFDNLIMAVAVDQDRDELLPAELEEHLLELSYLVDNQAYVTTKGEIHFPVMSDVSQELPYSVIRYSSSVSSCSFCHRDEVVQQYIGDTPIYQSQLMRPTQNVPLSRLLDESAVCNPEDEPHRCDMLRALTDFGSLYFQSFPANAPTFFD